MRMLLPILGMIEVAYGYNFDAFSSLSSSQDGSRNNGLFQFTLGQGF